MGQPVTVIEKSSSVPGVVRFEINRSITGMGIEYFASPESVVADRPVDELARRLFEHNGVTSVTVNSNMITVQMASGSSTIGLKGVIEELFLYYREGVEVVVPEGVSSD
jgi:Scaffold protein Nfu/NifU N terminal